MTIRAKTMNLDELLDRERFAPHRLIGMDEATLQAALETRRKGLRLVSAGRTYSHLVQAWSADVAAIERELASRSPIPGETQSPSASSSPA